MNYLTEFQIAQACRGLYEKQGCVVLSQVRNGVGFGRKPRTADVLAVSTWPSRGLFAEGIEIKSDRGDLRREIENPAKAEEIAQYCKMWWIAGAAGIAKDIELPETWGLIEVDDKLKAKVSRKATPNQAVKPMDTLFVCSVLRNFAENHMHVDLVKESIDKRVEEKAGERHRALESDLKELREAIGIFKAHSGVDLMTDWGRTRWDMKNIGQAVELVARMRGTPSDELERARALLGNASKLLDEAVKVVGASA